MGVTASSTDNSSNATSMPPSIFPTAQLSNESNVQEFEIEVDFSNSSSPSIDTHAGHAPSSSCQDNLLHEIDKNIVISTVSALTLINTECEGVGEP